MNKQAVIDLHQACQNKDEAKIKNLLANNSNPDQALAIIARYNNIDYLIWARKNITDINWALTECCHYSQLNCVEYLLQNGADDYSGGLKRSCRGGKLDNVKLMIDSGATNFIDGFNEACEFGHVAVIKHLESLEQSDFDRAIYERGMINACYGNQYDVVVYLATKDITNLQQALDACGEYINYMKYESREPSKLDHLTNKKIVDFLTTQLA